jgi:hypothetical protein
LVTAADPPVQRGRLRTRQIQCCGPCGQRQPGQRLRIDPIRWHTAARVGVNQRPWPTTHELRHARSQRRTPRLAATSIRSARTPAASRAPSGVPASAACSTADGDVTVSTHGDRHTHPAVGLQHPQPNAATRSPNRSHQPPGRRLALFPLPHHLPHLVQMVQSGGAATPCRLPRSWDHSEGFSATSMGPPGCQ